VEAEQIGGYKTQSLLQTGQSSQVYEVVELASLRHFAMKILLPEKAKDPEERRLLFHEAEVGKKLAHPNVIKIHEVNRNPTTPYFTMEFFPSGSLRTRLQQARNDPKAVEYLKQHSEKIFKQAATGLAYMNACGWIHRDVKPANILANGLGDVRIIDFAIAHRPPTGLAKMFHRKGRSQGTRSYMSPEQIRGLILDGRADVYSFGATVYEVLTGRPPFRGTSAQELLEKHIKEKPVNPRQYNPEITEDFAGLVLKMLEKKKEDRPGDFHEVLMAMRNMRVFKGQPVKREEGM
jgi:serine/threonine protein kinase